MSDFETRLGDALSSRAEGAPDVTGLADGARRRARRRRTTYTGVAAAVVLAVAVPVGVIALNDGGSGNGDMADDPVVAPSDTRIETWHDISVEVPASWGYGGRGGWCASGGLVETPRIERPGVMVPMILCDKATYSAGVTFGSATTTSPAYPSGHIWQYEAGDIAEYLPGTWLGFWYEGDDLVQVNAADQETVQEIIDSVERVDGADANGCPVVDDGGAGEVADDEVSVCRYSAEGDLEQSELLVGDDAAEAKAAIDSAPMVDAANDCANADGEHVVMTADGVRADIQYTGLACSDRGLFIGDEVRQLTEGVLYWALSPGWTGYAESWVPLPEKQRALPGPEPSEAPTAEGACPLQFAAEGTMTVVADEGVSSLCRYDLDFGAESGGTWMLDDEQELSGDDATRLVDAVEAAPSGPGPSSGTCRGGAAGRGELFLLLHADVRYWIYNTQCQLSGVEVQRGEELGEGHSLTPELLDALGSPHGLLR